MEQQHKKPYVRWKWNPPVSNLSKLCRHCFRKIKRNLVDFSQQL